MRRGGPVARRGGDTDPAPPSSTSNGHSPLTTNPARAQARSCAVGTPSLTQYSGPTPGTSTTCPTGNARRTNPIDAPLGSEANARNTAS